MTGLLLALLLLAGFKRKNALVGIPFKAFAFLAKKHALKLGDLPLEIVNLAFIPQRLLLGLPHLFLHLSQAAIRRLLRGTDCFFLLLKKVNKLGTCPISVSVLSSCEVNNLGVFSHCSHGNYG